MLTLIFLACANSAPASAIDSIPEEVIIEPDYVPTLDPEFPSNLAPIRWHIDENVPSQLGALIRETQREWHQALDCGKTMTETPSSQEADVVWRCGRGGETDWSGKVAYSRAEEQFVISIFRQVCENPHAGVPRHAWGHALGFAHSYRAYITTMDGGEVAHPEYSDNAMEETEIRGFEKWADSQGALTCGC